MTDPFILTVSLRGEERNFDTQWAPYGYTHRFTVDIEGVSVFFEPDEEGHYRAIIAPGQDESQIKTIDKAWLEAIRETIEDTLK
ncbi:MAG TPA: hypothetical protein VLD19_13215 [Chitinophagaceae bacterium]|nr:hypothetical protein [Chitinophagaceae bacterium]